MLERAAQILARPSPLELRRPAQTALAQLGREQGIVEQATKRRRELVRRARIAQEARGADDLGDRRDVARDDRGSTGHRLEHAVAEALVERRVEERGRAAVEPDELLVGDAAQELRARSARATGDEQAHARPAARLDRGL